MRKLLLVLAVSTMPVVAIAPAVAQHSSLAALQCMIDNLYHEARGEGIKGLQAVASVVMNRAQDDQNNICKIVYTRKQFSWTMAKQTKNIEGDISDILNVAQAATSNTLVDITGGATHYHTKKVKPYWAKTLVKTKTIGQHIFYKQHD
jgi:spore germination cell wall hydrolase CwlJ-like protein